MWLSDNFKGKPKRNITMPLGGLIPYPTRRDAGPQSYDGYNISESDIIPNGMMDANPVSRLVRDLVGQSPQGAVQSIEDVASIVKSLATTTTNDAEQYGRQFRQALPAIGAKFSEGLEGLAERGQQTFPQLGFSKNPITSTAQQGIYEFLQSVRKDIGDRGIFGVVDATDIAGPAFGVAGRVAKGIPTQMARANVLKRLEREVAEANTDVLSPFRKRSFEGHERQDPIFQSVDEAKFATSPEFERIDRQMLSLTMKADQIEQEVFRELKAANPNELNANLKKLVSADQRVKDVNKEYSDLNLEISPYEVAREKAVRKSMQQAGPGSNPTDVRLSIENRIRRSDELNALYETAKKWNDATIERYDRAISQGFNPFMWKHGTTANFPYFDPAVLGETTSANSAAEGFFFAADSNIAESYIRPARNWQEFPGVDFNSINARKNVLIPKMEDYKRKYISQNDPQNTLKVATQEQKDEFAALQTEFESIEADLSIGSPNRDALGGNIMPVHVNYNNPLIVEYGGRGYNDLNTFDSAGVPGYTKAILHAKENGYDAVILRNTKDHYVDLGVGTSGDGQPTDVLVVWNPGQIRSTKAQFADDKAPKFKGGAISDEEINSQMFDKEMEFQKRRDVVEQELQLEYEELLQTPQHEQVGLIKDEIDELAESLEKVRSWRGNLNAVYEAEDADFSSIDFELGEIVGQAGELYAISPRRYQDELTKYHETRSNFKAEVDKHAQKTLDGVQTLIDGFRQNVNMLQKKINSSDGIPKDLSDFNRVSALKKQRDSFQESIKTYESQLKITQEIIKDPDAAIKYKISELPSNQDFSDAALSYARTDKPKVPDKRATMFEQDTSDIEAEIDAKFGKRMDKASNTSPEFQENYEALHELKKLQPDIEVEFETKLIEALRGTIADEKLELTAKKVVKNAANGAPFGLPFDYTGDRSKFDSILNDVAKRFDNLIREKQHRTMIYQSQLDRRRTAQNKAEESIRKKVANRAGNLMYGIGMMSAMEAFNADKENR